MHGSFGFSLSEIDLELEQLVRSAQANLDSDPYTSLLKLRMCAECLQDKLVRIYRVETKGADGYEKGFAKLRDELRNSIGQRITNEFYQLYSDGSEGAHYPRNISTSEARYRAHISIDRVHTIAQWLLEKHPTSSAKYTSFSAEPSSSRPPPPTPPRRNEYKFIKNALVLAVAACFVFAGWSLLSHPNTTPKPTRTANSNPTPTTNLARPVIQPPAVRQPASPEIASIRIGQRLVNNRLFGQTEQLPAPVTNVAAAAEYQNAHPSSTKLRMVLAIGSKLKPCDDQVAEYEKGTFFCEWPVNLGPGEYSVYAYADGSSGGARFTITGTVPEAVSPPMTSATTSTMPSAPRIPVLTELRRIQVDVAPYIPQHIIFDDADQMVIPDHRGVAVLLDGRVVDPCASGGRHFTATQYGMYTFDSCGNTRTTLMVVKYVKR